MLLRCWLAPEQPARTINSIDFVQTSTYSRWLRGVSQAWYFHLFPKITLEGHMIQVCPIRNEEIHIGRHLKRHIGALTGWHSCLEHPPIHQKVEHCRFNSQSGHMPRISVWFQSGSLQQAANQWLPLSFSLMSFLPSSLSKINKHIFRSGF